MNLRTLKTLGFDDSRRSGKGLYAVRCSQCASCVVNGHPIHERGCPNDMHECHGCNEIIPARQRYCENCAI